MENNRFESQAPAEAHGAMPTPGAMLAAARLARGASLEDVARLLKLSVAQVRALEADDHSPFSGAVFVRGFMRSYARLLNLDIEPLLPARPEATPTPVREAQASRMYYKPGVSLEPRRNRKLPALLAGATFVLLGLAFYEFGVNTPPGSPRTVQGGAERGVPVAVSPAGMAGSRSGTGDFTPSASQSEISGLVVRADNLALKKSVDPTSGADERGLHFLFSGESWVEVKDGLGKIVFSRVNPPGSERIVHGDPPFTLVIGGASGVQLSYNGSRVDLASFSSEDVARLRLE